MSQSPEQDKHDGARTESLPASAPALRGSAIEVFLAFLKLGLTSFGGPVAHLGYFRAEFVERRAWLDDKSYSDLVALRNVSMTLLHLAS